MSAKSILKISAILAIVVALGTAPLFAQVAPVTPNTATPNTVTPNTVDKRVNSTTISPAEASPNTDASQNATSDNGTVKLVEVPTANRNDIKIGVGDLLAIKVYGVSELNDDVRVNGAGEISLPLIGMVHIEGLTSLQIERTLEKRLVDGGFLRDPHVMVTVKEYLTQGVSIMGEIAKPGIYPMIGARRLNDAIVVAGGPTTRTGSLVTITHKDHPETPVTVNLGPNFMNSNENNVDIFPGDLIVFSKAGIVYVVGDVGKPGGYVIENNEKMTVLMAMAMSGGPNKTAALNRVKIIRRSKEGQVQETIVELNKIMAGKVNDMDLTANDILFIPNSLAKDAGQSVVKNIFTTIAGLALYHPF